MEYRNPRYNAFGTIDCEINHRIYGWVPFTASPDDVEPLGRGVHKSALASGPKDCVAPPPEPPPVPQSLSFAQLLIGLVAEGWITEAEGDAWLGGRLPASVLQLIATLPSQQRFAAKARALRPSEVLRTDPLVEALGAAERKTPAELDQFFQTYAQV